MKKRWIAVGLGVVAAAVAGLYRHHLPAVPAPLTIQSGGRVEKLTLSSDGRLLADDCPAGQVKLYDTVTGQQRYAFAVRDMPSRSAQTVWFSPRTAAAC